MSKLVRFMPEKRRKKARLRIPESHALYLCPNACGRRQGIRLLMNDQADHASFLTFSQADVVLGDYLAQIEDAVEEVVTRVRPRVLTLYVNCIDDFLGTDAAALVDGLSARFPDVRFLLSRINPVSEDVAAGVGAVAGNAQAGLYAALEPSAVCDAGVNAVGAYVALPRECELQDALSVAGAGPLRQLPACETFEEYARMADSRCTLSLSSVGDAAAADMEARLGMPWMRWHACYDLDELERRYARLAELLGGPALSCTAYRARAEGAVERARQAVGSLPVTVDTAATFAPFSLACALLRYGFDVHAVFALHTKAGDEDAERELVQRWPHVRVLRQADCRLQRDFGIPQENLAVGADAARLVGSRFVLDMYHDEGYFGFQGVERLMDDMARAVRTGAGFHEDEEGLLQNDGLPDDGAHGARAGGGASVRASTCGDDVRVCSGIEEACSAGEGRPCAGGRPDARGTVGASGLGAEPGCRPRSTGARKEA